MNIVSLFLDSSVFMWVVTFICVIIGIRCAIHGFLGGTSTLLRILFTVIFAALAYFCWQRTGSLNGANAIDSFVYDSWLELKEFFYMIKSKF